MDDFFFDRFGFLETLKFSLDFGWSATEDSWLLKLDPCAVRFLYKQVTAVYDCITQQIKWLDVPSIIFISWQIFHFSMTKYEKQK